MKCLSEDCKNEFENKTGRRRFCSDACKMKWHRKHPKKNTATKLDIQVLLNEFKAAIQEMGTGVKVQQLNPISEKEAVALYNNTHPNQHLEISYVPSRTFEQYKQAKLECDDEHDWMKLKSEILASSLSARQKELLTKIN